jgi:hypothetical protein
MVASAQSFIKMKTITKIVNVGDNKIPVDKSTEELIKSGNNIYWQGYEAMLT